MIGLVKFLCWFLVVYYLLRVLSRLLAPILLTRFMNKIQERFRNQYNYQYDNPKTSNQDEGEVTIEKNNNSTKTKSDNIGDYIDFEEVED